jgi:predicted RND superfamily exporter protein
LFTASSRKKKVLKQASPLLLAIPVALALGLFYAKQHLPFHSDGFSADYQKAISEIDDLLSSNSNLEVGYDFTPNFLATVTKLKTDLTTLNGAVEKVTPIVDDVNLPRNAEELRQVINRPEIQNGIQAVKELETVWEQVIPEIKKVISDFSNEQFKQRAIAHKGLLISLLDASHLHGGYGLVADDFDDVSHALQTLEDDMAGVAQTLVGIKTFQQNALKQLTDAHQEVTKTFEPVEDEDDKEISSIFE